MAVAGRGEGEARDEARAEARGEGEGLGEEEDAAAEDDVAEEEEAAAGGGVEGSSDLKEIGNDKNPEVGSGKPVGSEKPGRRIIRRFAASAALFLLLFSSTKSRRGRITCGISSLIWASISTRDLGKVVSREATFPCEISQRNLASLGRSFSTSLSTKYVSWPRIGTNTSTAERRREGMHCVQALSLWSKKAEKHAAICLMREKGKRICAWSRNVQKSTNKNKRIFRFQRRIGVYRFRNGQQRLFHSFCVFEMEHSE